MFIRYTHVISWVLGVEVCDPEEDAEVRPALPGHGHPDTAQPRPRQAIAPLLLYVNIWSKITELLWSSDLLETHPDDEGCEYASSSADQA